MRIHFTPLTFFLALAPIGCSAERTPGGDAPGTGGRAASAGSGGTGGTGLNANAGGGSGNTTGGGAAGASAAGGRVGDGGSLAGAASGSGGGVDGGTAGSAGLGGAGDAAMGGANSTGGGGAGGRGQVGDAGDSASGGASGGGGLSSAGAGAGGTSGAGPTFHVFLLLGQSNMAGYAKAEAADKVEDARIRVLGFDDCTETGRSTDQWDTAGPPLHECWNGAVGPGDHFAKTLLSVIPSEDSIGLVPCAISGERIEAFLKVGGTRYDRLIERARLAQAAGGLIEGMIFHQGESNSGDSTWPGKVSTLVTDLRTDLGLGNVPFLAGELPYEGNSASHNTQVNRIPAMIAGSYVVSAADLVVDPADTQWNLHFDHDSTVELGKRYGAKMTEALGW